MDYISRCTVFGHFILVISKVFYVAALAYALYILSFLLKFNRSFLLTPQDFYGTI
jgi:hypothetical protein